MNDLYSNIVSDVDGTLIPLGTNAYEANFCSPRTVNAVRAAMDSGWRFSIATGRRFASAIRVHERLRANGDLVCYQGAMVVDGETHEVLVHERLEPDVALSITEYFLREGMEIRVYAEDELWVFPNGNENHLFGRRPSGKYELGSDPRMLAKSRPTTIVGVDDPSNMSSRIAEVEALLGDDALVTHSLAHFCEVGPAGAGKVKALDWLAQNRGLDQSRTVAFGDGLGDVEMLRWAGLGIAVGTELPEVLAAADESIEGPKEDGVAKKIEELVATCCKVDQHTETPRRFLRNT